MSANGNNGTFTEREIQMLGWAMQSLKTPPDVDYQRLAAFAGMSNPRSASNAWAKIRAKLAIPTGEGAPPATPKRGRAKKQPQDNDDGATPKTTPRKRGRPAKKDADGGEDGTPAKKRAVKSKVKVEDEGEDLVANAEDSEGTGDSPPAEAEEEV